MLNTKSKLFHWGLPTDNIDCLKSNNYSVFYKIYKAFLGRKYKF